jgi:hypothetical protein
MVRQALALLGLSCVVGAEAAPSGTLGGLLADLGVVTLAIAAFLAIIEPSRGAMGARDTGHDTAVVHSKRAWRWTLLGLGALGTLVAQSWFLTGMAIAGGDTTPPVGTAWIGRVFSLFSWSGSNLGGPAQLQGQLPWAAVDWFLHLFGGSGVLAQRIWLSALVAAILVATAALVRALGFGPLAGTAAALLYFFNPETLTDGAVNDVYLVTRVLLVALPAVLIAYSRGRIGLWASLVCFAMAAPFVGFAYSNPPLVGMVALTTAATPLLAWVRFGRPAAGRALRFVLVGGLVTVAASAYWLVPNSVAVGGIAAGRLSSLSAWGFTETRATIANALWLNTSWTWRYAIYAPYASDFARFPLGLVQLLLPLLAFSGLILRSPAGETGWRLTRLRGIVALGTLAVIFVSTGTRLPGALLFDPLYYHFPYGWLLREPGRFLMFAALGYALLAATLLEHWRQIVPKKLLTLRALPKPVPSTVLSANLTLATVLVLGLASAFPLWTGAVVPGTRQNFPSSHVTVPAYWLTTAHYLNTSAPSGALLVLPPDAYYQMPYRWYYGNDGFITDLVDRHVLDPSAQGYETVSTALVASVRLESSALLADDWAEADLILKALGTPLVLVRGDIVANFADRHIPSPTALTLSLARDPNMRLLHAAGLLKVYGPRKAYPGLGSYATVNSSTPDLRVLSRLPSGTALVTVSAIPGHIAIRQLPRVATWHLGARVLSTSVPEQRGWQYSALVLGLRPAITDSQVGLDQSQVASAQGASDLQLSLPVGASVIHNGTFSAGLWGPVGNCYDAHYVSSPNFLRANVLPRSGPRHIPALQLAASIDAACEATTLTWHGGAILLHLWVRSISGAPAKICLWEQPINRCAAVAPLPGGSGWHPYRTTVVPDPGATKVSLFLYAFPQSVGQASVEQYAGVIARALPYSPTIDVIGRPTTGAGPTRLIVYPTGYAPGWVGPPNARHVLVDGLRNGWLTTAGGRSLREVQYEPMVNVARDEILLASVMLLLAVASIFIWRRQI